jgi:two-component system OmpR family response regulator
LNLKKVRILVVEDDKIINSSLSKILGLKGYAVDSALNKEIAFKHIDISPYDLILLDLGLPDGSGLDVLKKFRENNNASGVIILSARDDKKVIKGALDLGADDYMVKPIDIDELLSRINALVRRLSAPIQNIIDLDKVKIDRDKMTIEKYNSRKKIWETVDVTKKEFAILEYLAVNRGKVVSQEEIIEHAWDESADMFSSAIRTHIKNLRKKVGDCIETVKGVGYKIS